MMPLTHTCQRETGRRVLTTWLPRWAKHMSMTGVAFLLCESGQAWNSVSSPELANRSTSGEASTLQVPDFYIYCRLASRTELTGNYTRSIAVLGSDTTIAMESMVASGGLISLEGYIAEATVNATVSADLGVLTTLSDSVFLGQANLREPKILGLVRPGQTFRIISSVKGPEGGEPALFHRIELRGRLVSPSFNQCSSRANLR